MPEYAMEPDGTLMQVYVYRNPGVDDPDLFDSLARRTWARYVAFFGSAASPPDPLRDDAVVARGSSAERCRRKAVRVFLATYWFEIEPVLVASLPPLRTRSQP